jgi:hypothetical protein
VLVIFEKKHIGDGFGIAYGCSQKERAMCLVNRSTILFNLT